MLSGPGRQRVTFTDRSPLYAAVHEDGINRMLRHLRRQRPSLFNYATSGFAQYLRPFLCVPIDATDKVLQSGQPLFTTEQPLPVVGAVRPIGLEFCLQLTDATVDLSPGSILTLPPELGTLADQQFALRASACFGLGCPDDRTLRELVVAMEAAAAADMMPTRPAPDPQTTPRSTSTSTAPAFAGNGTDTPSVVPAGEVICFCLDVFGVGHIQWRTVAGDTEPWLTTRLDGLEVVDIETVPASRLEDIVECYLRQVLELGVLPRLMLPMERLMFDVTRMLQDNAPNLGQQVTLVPAAVPADVPYNPAVEHDELRVYVKLQVRGH